MTGQRVSAASFAIVLTIGGLLGLVGCSKSTKSATTSDVLDAVEEIIDPNAPIEMEEGIADVTVSRVGRPRIVELLFFDDQPTYDEFNTMSPDKDNTNPTAGHAKKTIDALLALNASPNVLNLSGLDPQFADLELDSSTLHNMLILSGNVLKVDLDGTNHGPSGGFVAVTEGLLGVELGFVWTTTKKSAFGGRLPRTDAFNVFLTLLTSGALTSDSVDGNDSAYRQEFPYLPQPH